MRSLKVGLEIANFEFVVFTEMVDFRLTIVSEKL